MAEERVPRAGDRRDVGGGVKKRAFPPVHPVFPPHFLDFPLRKGVFAGYFPKKCRKSEKTLDKPRKKRV